MADNEILEKILDKLDSLETGQKALQSDMKEVKADVKHIKKQVDTLYEWVDGIDIDVKNVKDAVYNKA